MKKNEFLNLLKNKLQVLEEDEVKDILEEYENHIEMKIKEGKTEEEAIRDFGNIDDLTKEILKAYKISDRYTESKESNWETKLNEVVNKIVIFFQDFAKKISSKGSEEIIAIVVKVVLLLLGIAVLKLPFYLIESIGVHLFQSLPSIFSSTFSMLWKVIVEFSYLIVAIFIIYYFVKHVIIEDKMENASPKSLQKERIESSPKKKRENQAKEEPIERKEARHQRQKELLEKRSHMTNPFRIIIQILVVLFTLPCVFIAAFLILGMGIMIAFAFQGVFLLSAFCILSGLILIAVGFLGLVYHLAFKGVK